jgi:hypothetical protein
MNVLAIGLYLSNLDSLTPASEIYAFRVRTSAKRTDMMHELSFQFSPFTTIDSIPEAVYQ